MFGAISWSVKKERLEYDLCARQPHDSRRIKTRNPDDAHLITRISSCVQTRVPPSFLHPTSFPAATYSLTSYLTFTTEDTEAHRGLLKELYSSPLCAPLCPLWFKSQAGFLIRSTQSFSSLKSNGFLKSGICFERTHISNVMSFAPVINATATFGKSI